MINYWKSCSKASDCELLLFVYRSGVCVCLSGVQCVAGSTSTLLISSLIADRWCSSCWRLIIYIYTQTHNQLTFDSVPRWHTSRVTLTLLSLSALCDVLQPTESDSSSAFIHLTPNLLLLADWAAILCLRQSELFLDTFSQESLCLYSHRSH